MKDLSNHPIIGINTQKVQYNKSESVKFHYETPLNCYYRRATEWFISSYGWWHEKQFVFNNFDVVKDEGVSSISETNDDLMTFQQ